MITFVLLLGVLPILPETAPPVFGAETQEADVTENGDVKTGDTDNQTVEEEGDDSISEKDYDPAELGDDWWIRVGMPSVSSNYRLGPLEKEFYDGLMAAMDKFFREPTYRVKSQAGGNLYYIPYSVVARKELVERASTIGTSDKNVFWFFYHSNPQFYFLQNRVITKRLPDGSRKYWMVIYGAFTADKKLGDLIPGEEIAGDRPDDVLRTKLAYVNRCILAAKSDIEEDLAGKSGSSQPIRRAMAVHDWICRNVDYDYFASLRYTPDQEMEELSEKQRALALAKNRYLNAYYGIGNPVVPQASGRPSEEYTMSQSAVGVFVEKPEKYPLLKETMEDADEGSCRYRAVCAGYAGAYQILCNLICREDEVKAVRVTSETHQWNMILMPSYRKEQSFLVDTTWDDFGDREDYPTGWQSSYQYFARCYYRVHADEAELWDNTHLLDYTYDNYFRQMYFYGRWDFKPEPQYFMRETGTVPERYAAVPFLSQETVDGARHFSPWVGELTSSEAFGFAPPTVRGGYTLSEDGQYLKDYAGKVYQSDAAGSYIISPEDDRFYRAVKFYPTIGNYVDTAVPYDEPVDPDEEGSGETPQEKTNGQTGGSSAEDGNAVPQASGTAQTGSDTKQSSGTGQAGSDTTPSGTGQTGGGTSSPSQAAQTGNGASQSFGTGQSSASSGSGSSDTPVSSSGEKKDFLAGEPTIVKGSGGQTEASYEKTGRDTVSYTDCFHVKKGGAVAVPASVKMFGKAYRVTDIRAGAFLGLTGIKRITLGKNIQKIHPKAFSGCRKLQVLEIRSKALSPKTCRRALSGTGVRKLTVPSSEVLAYRKVFAKTKIAVTGGADTPKRTKKNKK